MANSLPDAEPMVPVTLADLDADTDSERPFLPRIVPFDGRQHLAPGGDGGLARVRVRERRAEQREKPVAEELVNEPRPAPGFARLTNEA
jgi:hypothetical protein